MSRKKKALSEEEIEAQNGEELPEREVMSIVALDPEPIPMAHPDGAAENPETYPGEPQE